jgi:uncharacterized phage-associated protein
MRYRSTVVANRLLELANQCGRNLTPMQLLKLAFLCHGWMLGLYGRPLISDRIEAWKYGPVIPKLYHAVKQFRGSPITVTLSAPQQELSAEADNIVEQVFDIYGSWTGPQLSHLTHEDGSPWAQTYDEDRLGVVIPDRVIRRFYEQQAA